MKQVKISRLSGLLSLVISCLISAISCTGVDYGYIDEGFGAPEGFGKSKISPDFDWRMAPGSQVAELPDTMNVLMARKVDEIHYAWVVNRDFVPHKAAEPFRPLISKGEYGVLAFYAPKESYKTKPVSDFVSDNRSPIMGYSASLNYMTTKEQNEISGTFASDYAPEYKVVKAAAPLWSASSMDFRVSDTLHTLTLTPNLLTLSMNFKLRIKLEAGVSVTAVTGMFTGVPTGVSLMYGTVQAGDKAKVLFKMGKESGSSANVVYSGQITTLGVLPVGEGSFAVGNCVLYLAIDTEVKGQSKRLYSAINLRNNLAGLLLMEPENRGLEYRLICNSLDFTVPGQLVLNGDKILSGAGALVEWN